MSRRAEFGWPCVTDTGLRVRYAPFPPGAKQLAFLSLVGREALFGGAAGAGKAVHVDEVVPTTRGWATMGDLDVGDYVYGADGQPHAVLAASETMVLPGWEFTFDDGTTITTNDEHLWRTFDANELASLTRRDPQWRQARRESRPSRSAVGDGATGHSRSHREYLSATMTARNAANSPAVLPAPIGTVRRTADIAATLRLASGRTNHAVALAAAVCRPEADLPIDPYVLGVWLGDGTANDGAVTSMDPDVIAAVVAAGYPERRRTPKGRAVTVWFDGFRPALRSAGVFANKHIPDVYLWASESQRVALLAGLLDTDGHVSPRGTVEFTNTNHQLAVDVHHLAVSLSMKASIAEGRATLNGRDCGPKWRVTFTPHRDDIVRLDRKRAPLRDRTPRRTTRFRYVVDARRVEPVPMRCIRTSAADGLFLVGRNMVPTHNSLTLLLAALQFADVPGYNALLLRRTLADLKLPDSLIPMSKWLLEGRGPTYNANEHTWSFPSGATLQFGYLRSPGDELRYQGSQVQFVGWDELTQFPVESQYEYLFSRLRRPKLDRDQMIAHFGVSPDGLTLADIPLRVRAATNPGGPGMHWVKRRFVDPDTAIAPFMPSFFTENPGIDASEYRASLSSLSEVERRRLELGDWDAVEVPGALWRFTDIGRVDAVPGTFDTVAMGVDGSVSEGTGDECGIVVGGIASDGVVTVLADLSMRGHPDEWAKRAVTGYHEYGCTRLVIEVNQGGEMNRMILNNAADVLGVDRPHVVMVRANAGESKELRAQPIAQAYRAGKVVHAPEVRDTALEAQMCFVAGTPVLTDSGWTPIEAIAVGERVLTRGGWRRVDWSGSTGVVTTVTTVTLANGNRITSTPNHPFWIEGEGWVRADHVAQGARLHGCPDPLPSNLRSSSTVECGSTRTPLRRIAMATRPGSITAPIGNLAPSSIGSYGRTPTARSPKDAWFTTATGTLSTTIRRIWSALRERPTTRDIGWAAPSPTPIPITQVNVLASNGSTASRVMSPALRAGSYSSRPGCEPCSAPVSVVAVTTRRCVATEVFDLTVEGHHEFFACGVLVHNSSWVPGDRLSVKSPDRVDALVWLVAHLLFRAGTQAARSTARSRLSTWETAGAGPGRKVAGF